MVKVINTFLGLGFFTASFIANADQTIENHDGLGIPYELISLANESTISFSEDKITILAKKGTDLYTNADGSSSADNAPRVFFQPKSDFTLSAKVTADFTKAYDGGALFVYADTDNWAKFLFERFKSGDNGIASTVTKTTGDDTYHNLVSDNEIYLRITRKDNSMTLFYSDDGQDWLYRRSFSLKSTKPIKVGFLAQSPISTSHKVVYSDIHFNQ